MPKEAPEKFAQRFAAERAEMFQKATSDETIFLLAIARAVCDMLAAGQVVTLDSLLEECIRRRGTLEQREKPEQNPEWHRLNAALAHLESLKK